MPKLVEKPQVSDHYNAVADHYHEQYEKSQLYDVNVDYPANQFRLQLLLNSFVNKSIKRVIEVGVGEGTPLITLAKTGVDVWGFDVSQKMVERSKENLKKNKLDSDKIFWGDIQDSITYAHALKEGQFDGLMAMGVMPHVENDDLVMRNLSSLVRPGGTVFIEFRNKLFSLFTFNRNTFEFIMDDLLVNVDVKIKDAVAKELKAKLRMDLPPMREKLEDSGAPGYDVILSKFHNPFEVIDLFKKHNYKDINLLWYHYHPGMPFISDQMPELYRKEAVQLEHESSGWRGLFLCSAFVVEAVKI